MMLRVENLSIYFADYIEQQEVVQGISFVIEPGEILGIVGESGSGKTMTALTIVGLKKPHQIIKEGRIYLDEKELLGLTDKVMRTVQGNEIGMIFQEPMTALNPTMRIGKQVEEALVLHTKLNKRERRKKVIQALQDVELENPEELFQKYPHELSGGMRQRVMIAAAMICQPKLLIADEPTTALDVDTQDAILKLLKKLNQKYQMSILFISHNLRVVNELCSRVIVMKAGEIVEQGQVATVFQSPQAEYTKELIAAIPTRLEDSLVHRLRDKKAGERLGR